MPLPARSFALMGCALGFALGSWNIVSFWLDPLDDSLTGMFIVYAPMFISWAAVPYMVARRTGRLADAIKAGTVLAASTFVMFWVMNIIRVNIFLDVLREWPGWQMVVARYRESGFESFRAFTNYDYLKDAPLKIAVPTVIGALLGTLGGLTGRRHHRQAQS